jgi:hypothetical protein
MAVQINVLQPCSFSAITAGLGTEFGLILKNLLIVENRLYGLEVENESATLSSAEKTSRKSPEQLNHTFAILSLSIFYFPLNCSGQARARGE